MGWEQLALFRGLWVVGKDERTTLKERITLTFNPKLNFIQPQLPRGQTQRLHNWTITVKGYEDLNLLCLALLATTSLGLSNETGTETYDFNSGHVLFNLQFQVKSHSYLQQGNLEIMFSGLSCIILDKYTAKLTMGCWSFKHDLFATR